MLRRFPSTIHRVPERKTQRLRRFLIRTVMVPPPRVALSSLKCSGANAPKRLVRSVSKLMWCESTGTSITPAPYTCESCESDCQGVGDRHAAVSQRPSISLPISVARTEGYTYDSNVWDLSIVQGPFSVSPKPLMTLMLRRRGVPASGRCLNMPGRNGVSERSGRAMSCLYRSRGTSNGSRWNATSTRGG